MDLKISNPETEDIIISFQKKSATDCPPIKLTFYYTMAKINEEIEFYNYFQHLQKFGFVCEYSPLDFRYSIEISKDQKKLIRKMTMSKIARKKLFVDESTVSLSRAIQSNDLDWPFPQTYFKNIGLTVRGFNFSYPNLSKSLKNFFQPSQNLLNIESGTEEASTVPTQYSFYPTQQQKNKKK